MKTEIAVCILTTLAVGCGSSGMLDDRDGPGRSVAKADEGQDFEQAWSGRYFGRTVFDAAAGEVAASLTIPMLAGLDELIECSGETLVRMVDTYAPGTVSGSFLPPLGGGCPVSTTMERANLAAGLTELVRETESDGDSARVLLASVYSALYRALDHIVISEMVELRVDDGERRRLVHLAEVDEVGRELSAQGAVAPRELGGGQASLVGTLVDIRSGSANAGWRRLEGTAQPAEVLSLEVGRAAFRSVRLRHWELLGTYPIAGHWLAPIVHCDKLAAAVGASLGATVGDALARSCSQGLNDLYERIAGEMEGIRLTASTEQLEAGRFTDATQQRPDVDDVADRFEIDFGWHLEGRSVPATFDGARIRKGDPVAPAREEDRPFRFNEPT